MHGQPSTARTKAAGKSVVVGQVWIGNQHLCACLFDAADFLLDLATRDTGHSRDDELVVDDAGRGADHCCRLLCHQGKTRVYRTCGVDQACRVDLSDSRSPCNRRYFAHHVPIHLFSLPSVRREYEDDCHPGSDFDWSHFRGTWRQAACATQPAECLLLGLCTDKSPRGTTKVVPNIEAKKDAADLQKTLSRGLEPRSYASRDLSTRRAQLFILSQHRSSEAGGNAYSLGNDYWMGRDSHHNH
jgi:hypothetical protein